MTSTGKTIAWGLLLIPAWFLALFGMSLIFGADDPSNMNGANIATAFIVGGIAFGLGRMVGLEGPRRSWLVGAVWAFLLLAVLLLVGIGNATLGVIFGNWSMYLGYVGIVAGAALSGWRSPGSET